MTDRQRVLQQARTYIGVDGDYVCNEKLHLGFVCDWCAYSISSIMKDCDFIGKYQSDIYGFASDAAREDDGVLGEWFLKGEKPVQAGDYIMFRYSSFIKRRVPHAAPADPRRPGVPGMRLANRKLRTNAGHAEIKGDTYEKAFYPSAGADDMPVPCRLRRRCAGK